MWGGEEGSIVQRSKKVASLKCCVCVSHVFQMSSTCVGHQSTLVARCTLVGMEGGGWGNVFIDS